MIYRKLAELLHLDDHRFDESHVEAIKHAVEHYGSAKITVTVDLKPKSALVGVVDSQPVRIPMFELVRQVKVTQPIESGKEQLNLGYVKMEIYVDPDGEIVTFDELPVGQNELDFE